MLYEVITARKLYEKMYELSQNGIFSSCASVAAGGLVITLAKMAISGCLGLEADLSKAPNRITSYNVCYTKLLREIGLFGSLSFIE